MVHRIAALLLALPLTATAAQPLEIVGAEASSTYTESGNYSAERAVDGKQGTSWVEGDEGSGLGAYLTVDLGKAKNVTAIRLWAGDWNSWADWQRANRPKEVELKFDDDSTQMVTLKDEKVAQTFEIEGGKSTQHVRIKLKSTYGGSAWFDTGISEVQLLGDGDDARITGTAKASSEAPEDGDGNYLASNATDGLLDSMWCEGDKAGDGTGEWLAIDFGAKRTFDKVTLLNGIGSSMSLWMKANQATGLKFTYDDGSSYDLAIERPSFRPATFEIPEVTTATVKITATSVKPGREFNDLCLSEVHFSR